MPANTRKIFLSLVFLVAWLTLPSCDSKRFYEENVKIDKNAWKARDKAIFNVTITDNVSLYEFYINIRNAGNYPYSNIYLFLKTTFPGGRIARDTIECQLADYEGKWLGSGISDVKFNRFLFRKGVQFPQKGPYIFEIEQAMRVNELKGISDIGIRLEKE